MKRPTVIIALTPDQIQHIDDFWSAHGSLAGAMIFQPKTTGEETYDVIAGIIISPADAAYVAEILGGTGLLLTTRPKSPRNNERKLKRCQT